MAENDSSQEKTEEPTGRRLEQAREKGQIARSKELGTAAVLLASSVGFMMTGPALAKSLFRIMEQIFTMERAQIFDTNSMFRVWGLVGTELAIPLMSFIVMVAVVSFLGNIVLGGINFSVKAFMPKGSKMNPVTLAVPAQPNP